MANMVISMAIFSSTKEYFSFFAKYSALEGKFTFLKIVISCMDIFCEKNRDIRSIVYMQAIS